MILGVGVCICPRAAIPMGAEKDAFLQLGLECTDDIACRKYGAIIGSQDHTLRLYLCAISLELSFQPIATETMRLAIRYTRTKGHLPGGIVIGTIGIESRYHNGSL